MINLDSNFNKIYNELNTINEATEYDKYIKQPRYSGDFRGLNYINTEVTPQELERKARKEAEEKEQQAIEYERQKPELERQDLERRKLTAIGTANKSIRIANEKGDLHEIHLYHNRNYGNIIKHDYWPAIDLDTKELVYDAEAKEKILKASSDQLYAYRSAISKKVSADRKKRLENEYTWTAHYTNFYGESATSIEKVQGNDDPAGACESVKQKAIDVLKKEMQMFKKLNTPIRWDGKLIITVTPPHGKEEVYKQYKFNTKA